MEAVYLRDIRSDGFALFFARLLGEEAEGGEAICGILSGMILSSVFLMMVALAHNGYTTGPALKQLLLHRLSVDPGGDGLYTVKGSVFIEHVCVCVHKHMGAFKTVCIIGVCVFEQRVWETARERERESFYLYCQGIITQHTLEYPV